MPKSTWAITSSIVTLPFTALSLDVIASRFKFPGTAALVGAKTGVFTPEDGAGEPPLEEAKFS